MTSWICHGLLKSRNSSAEGALLLLQEFHCHLEAKLFNDALIQSLIKGPSYKVADIESFHSSQTLHTTTHFTGFLDSKVSSTLRCIITGVYCFLPWPDYICSGNEMTIYLDGSNKAFFKK